MHLCYATGKKNLTFIYDMSNILYFQQHNLTFIYAYVCVHSYFYKFLHISGIKVYIVYIFVYKLFLWKWHRCKHLNDDVVSSSN